MNIRQHILPTRSCAARGFTVVEILVALAISLILLLGVVEIFMASKASYSLQSGVARLQENARFALDTMARSLSLAGLDTSQDNTTISPFNSATTLDNVDQNTAAPYNFTTALGTASDRISVNYMSATNCLGNSTGAAGIATDTYYIDIDPNTGVPNLYCNNQPLVEGVENMQILYGQDTKGATPTSGPDGTPESYLSAANVTEWGTAFKGGISSVRIALLVSTVDNAGVTDTRSYRLLNAPAMGPFNDQMVRRVYTRNILLRNYTYTP